MGTKNVNSLKIRILKIVNFQIVNFVKAEISKKIIFFQYFFTNWFAYKRIFFCVIIPNKRNYYHFGKFILCFSYTFTIVGIHDEYEALRVLEIMPPKGSNLVLTTHVPDGETDVFVFHGLDIET